MSSHQLESLLRHLARTPQDLDAWTRLGRWCRRFGRLPPLPDPAALPWLVAAWRRAPRDRTLAPLFVQSFGLAFDPVAEVPAWFQRKRRSRGRAPDVYDARFGMPLAARHRATGMALRWIPAPPGGVQGTLGYYVGRYPVRVREYAVFLAAAGHREPVDMLGRDPFKLQLRDPDRPVVLVSCEDARAFSRWAGGLLPDGALWSWAARGPAPRRFPWGEQAPTQEHASFNHGVPWRGGDWDRYLSADGARVAGEGPFGLRDMAGGVREWSEERVRSPGEASLSPQGSWKHVVRGGSWGSSRVEDLEVECRTSSLEPGAAAHDVGFRLFLPVPCGGDAPWDASSVAPGSGARGDRSARRRRRRKRKRRLCRR